jgi:hypothetical protein
LVYCSKENLATLADHRFYSTKKGLLFLYGMKNKDMLTTAVGQSHVCSSVSLDEKPSALLSPFCSKRTLSCDATSVTR